jgi:hypothetical protein
MASFPLVSATGMRSSARRFSAALRYQTQL